MDDAKEELEELLERKLSVLPGTNPANESESNSMHHVPEELLSEDL